MSFVVVSDAIGLSATVLLPIIGFLLLGALVAGLLRAATQIDDPVLSLAGKFLALAILLSLGTDYLFTDVVSFAERIWGGDDFFH